MGVIAYEDMFGIQHLTEFCYWGQYPYVDWENCPAGQPLTPMSSRCDTHNCEDDECGTDWRGRVERLK
jgi:hypothetical protein